MRPPSSPSDGGSLFGGLSGAPAVDEQVGDRAWLAALLDAERALARAQARAGLLTPEEADAVEMAAARVDLGDLGRRAVRPGNPAAPLADDLRAAAPAAHHGATSQDVLDTAASLVAHRALGPLLADLRGTAEACARLARAHRDTLMAGRTLAQHALPITFGLKCAGWLVAVDEAVAGLDRVRTTRLAVQFGGAAGTLAAAGDRGTAVLRLYAEELGLAEPAVPWHTNRTRFGELAGALGVAAGVLGKIALDVVLLAQTEVAEVTEAEVGGSSAMPHKRNPVRAVLVRAAAARVPGLVATLLAGLAQEHERAAGAWHAEWETLRDLLHLVGGAAGHGRALLTGLRVDAARMRRNVDLTGGLMLAENVVRRLAPVLGGEARGLVTRVCAEAEAAGRPLREALLAEPAVRAHLDPRDVDAALDPAGYLGAAAELVDRALAAHDGQAE